MTAISSPASAPARPRPLLHGSADRPAAASHSPELASEARNWTQPPVERRESPTSKTGGVPDTSVRYDLD